MTFFLLQFVWGIGAGLGFALGFKAIVLLAQRHDDHDDEPDQT